MGRTTGARTQSNLLGKHGYTECCSPGPSQSVQIVECHPRRGKDMRHANCEGALRDQTGDRGAANPVTMTETSKETGASRNWCLWFSRWHSSLWVSTEPIPQHDVRGHCAAGHSIFQMRQKTEFLTAFGQWRSRHKEWMWTRVPWSKSNSGNYTATS